jgi:hypothetical protein
MQDTLKITPEMSWQETLAQYRKLKSAEEQMALSPQERTRVGSAMFCEYRAEIIASMPSGFSEQDQKRYIYQRTYGESLPEDFFDRKK